MRNPRCCICGNKREAAFLHYFPVSDQKKLKQWLECVNLESLNTLPKVSLATRSVCHVHFEKRFTKSNSRLRYGAYPSLFTPDEITSGVPSQQYPDISLEYQNVPTRHSDHSYFKNDPAVKVPTLTGSSKVVDCVGNSEHSYARKKHYDHTYSMSTLTINDAAGPSHINTDSDIQDTDTKKEENKLDINSKEDGDQIETGNNDDFLVSSEEEFTTDIVGDIGDDIVNENIREDRIFSWQKTELIEADDSEDPKPAAVPERPEQPTTPEDLTLSMFCESEPPPLPPEPCELVIPDDEYRCEDCAAIIDGFSWWCAQCSCGALCGACALRVPHDAHYVLRAPPRAMHNQTQAVLAVIRRELIRENLLSLYEIDEDGVKVEIKDEAEERVSSSPLPVATPDPLALEPHLDLLNVEPHPDPPNVEPHPDPLSVEPHPEDTDNECLDAETFYHPPIKRPRLSRKLQTNSTDFLQHPLLKAPTNNQEESQTVQTSHSDPRISQNAILATASDNVLPVPPTDLRKLRSFLQATASDPRISPKMLNAIKSDLEGLETILKGTPSDPAGSGSSLRVTNNPTRSEIAAQVDPNDLCGSQTILQVDPRDLSVSQTILQVAPSDFLNTDLIGLQTVLQVDPSNLSESLCLQIDSSDPTRSQTVQQIDPSDHLGSQIALQLDTSDLIGLQDVLLANTNDPTESQTYLQIDPSDLIRIQDILLGTTNDPLRSETVQQVDSSNINKLQICLQDNTDRLGSQTILQLNPSDLEGLQDVILAGSSDPTGSQPILQINPSDLERLQDILQGTTSDPFRSETVLHVDANDLIRPQELLTDPRHRTVSQSLRTPSDVTESKSVPKVTLSESIGSKFNAKVTPSDSIGSESLQRITRSRALSNIIARNRDGPQPLHKKIKYEKYRRLIEKSNKNKNEC